MDQQSDRTPDWLNEAEVVGQGEDAAVKRQRRAASSREKRNNFLRRHAGKISIGVAIAALAGYGTWAVNDTLQNHERFTLAEVTLLGTEHVAQSEIQEKFSSDRGGSVFRIPMEERRQEIEQITWVKSASIGRFFPNRIKVYVEERVPVAFSVSGDGIDLVDEDGVLLGYPPEAKFDLPVVRGLSEKDSAEDRQAKMKLFMAVSREIASGDENWSKVVSEVDLTDPRDARIVVADNAGAVRLHLGNEGFLNRYKTYMEHIGEWRKKFSNIQSVDLRYSGQVVLNADPAAPKAADRKNNSGTGNVTATLATPQAKQQR
ncbi:MAG: hypothetical protein A3F68_09435 [Acidobacteria bacterium RIFCSPLOWO2_12_FULL_54_10]|nr:MAG: hypothetical protein A3F68_09435 [Acidobacteria bacterium RIFCSPLOWO2_12_FULL_54_10]